MTSTIMYTARYGGVAFDCISTSDNVSRALVRHTFPRKDGALLQDMGAEPRETRLRCIFYETPPDDDLAAIQNSDGSYVFNYLERYEQFYSQVNSGVIQEFEHPIFGSYRAMAENIETSASEDEIEVLMIDCTFVEDSTSPSPFDFSASQPVDAGISAVKVEAAKLDAALLDAGVTSSVPTDSVEMVSAWRNDETISARRVNLELQSLSNQIANTITEFELNTDLSRQPIWRSTQRLQGQVRRAAQLFHQKQPQIFSFTVMASTPLRVLVTDMYGASEHSQRYDELIRLNDISDPMLIKEGTRLKATSPNTERSKGLRSAV